MDDNCGEWVESMGVVSRMWVESMGVASGCGCKEVYRFPHITYPYSSCTCICSFLQQHPYVLFVHLKKYFSFFYTHLNTFFNLLRTVVMTT